MPTHNDENLLERYQREHRVYEGMNMSKHTPGKLALSEDGRPEMNNQSQIIESEKGDLIVYFKFTNKADASRLVACWNACDGLSTDLLENIVMVGDTLNIRFDARSKEESALIAERDRLSAINAELLKALIAMKHKLRIDDPLDMYDSVCEAIAKAQGEQP